MLLEIRIFRKNVVSFVPQKGEESAYNYKNSIKMTKKKEQEVRFEGRD